MFINIYDTTHASPYIYIRIHYQYHIAIHILYSKHEQNIPKEENTSIHNYTYNPKTQQTENK